MTHKQNVIAALYAWIQQRPGLEYGNYGDANSYRAEMRGITRDLSEARTMLRAIERRESITAEHIIEAAKHSYSGRLMIAETSVCTKCHRDPTLQHNHAPRIVIDYCTGQYWPTEYRRAVCAVLASVLWGYWRDGCMPPPCGKKNTLRDDGSIAYSLDLYRMPGSRATGSAGDYLRAVARREFGRGIAQRWFQ